MIMANSIPNTSSDFLKFTSIPERVHLKQDVSLTSLDNGETLLTNPISVTLYGSRAFIQTKLPLENIRQENKMQSTEPALRGPLFLNNGDRRTNYTVNLQVPFKAELEPGIQVKSDGQGLIELQKDNKTTLVLDASAAVKFLTKAKPPEVPKKVPTRDQNEATILQMHSKTGTVPDSLSDAA
jgi:hypothetical protein